MIPLGLVTSVKTPLIFVVNLPVATAQAKQFIRAIRYQYLALMNYQTFPPHPDLQALVKCYWTLEVPAQANPPKQCIIPDGCIEMAFLLGEDVKRYTTNEAFILQPHAMVLGQITEPFYIEPTGYVNTFAVRFYPYGFANFVTTSINSLVNKETPLELLFGEEAAKKLAKEITQAKDTAARIAIIESFLVDKLNNETTIDIIVKSTIDNLIAAKGSLSIQTILRDNLSKRRQLERKFLQQIGMSPKQLGKVIRLQAALELMLQENTESLTSIAYEAAYYDQAHFIRDFKELTGTTPSAFLNNENMELSSLFYKKD
jgi:AraC-like DNA-binding protein